MSKEEIIEALESQFSADKVLDMTPNQLGDKLMKAGFIHSLADMNCLVIEGLQHAARDDDEFPIHYYKKDEPMSEKGRDVGHVECLTDDYIANNFTT